MPSDSDLKEALGNTFHIWNSIKDFTLQNVPKAAQEWKYASAKFGWGFRISDSRRVLVYLLPRDGFFRVGLVFGPRAVEAVLTADISAEIKKELFKARAHTEGKGIRIEVRTGEPLADIKELVRIKLQY